MTTENITTGEAAQRAKSWAQKAQDFQEMMEVWRIQNLETTTERGFSPSRKAELEKTVDDMARARDEMVVLANMWANVAGALHLVEGKKP